MPSGFLNADNGAILVCRDCGAQVRDNEHHHCPIAEQTMSQTPSDQENDDTGDMPRESTSPAV